MSHDPRQKLFKCPFPNTPFLKRQPTRNYWHPNGSNTFFWAERSECTRNIFLTASLVFWGNGLFPKFAVNHHLKIQTRGAPAWLYTSMVQAKTKKDMFIYYTTKLIIRYYTTKIIIVKNKMTMNFIFLIKQKLLFTENKIHACNPIYNNIII